MQLSIVCPGCQKKLAAKFEQAGKKIKCPSCAQKIELPNLPARGSSTLAGTPTVSGGASGPGGNGGLSAPTAPDGERDGSGGHDGPEGTAGEVLDCAAETSC